MIDTPEIRRLPSAIELSGSHIRGDKGSDERRPVRVLPSPLCDGPIDHYQQGHCCCGRWFRRYLVCGLQILETETPPPGATTTPLNREYPPSSPNTPLANVLCLGKAVRYALLSICV